ncbi:unnamed protein product [marine sediment metagenome]|uniref:Uncharacterized protein n=1 Tax=marine sediment metagenome TaxID=412755 RepID=X1A7T9_9ZZZZ
MAEVMTCPECGAKEDETVKSMFSVREPAIRRQGEYAECVKCGFQGRIPKSLLSEKQ